MTERSTVLKGLVAILLATSVASAPPLTANAQSSPWWPGDTEVILGYGCTAVELEPYDSRFSCPKSSSHVHEGIDIDLPYGTPIYAGWPGTVVEVGGGEAHDYGPHYVKIWLDEGHDILLGHLSRATVVRGQRVEIGALVGYVGDLGVADIPNLDFGARPHGGGEYQSIDPTPYLAFLDRSRASQSFAGQSAAGEMHVLARSMLDGRVWSVDSAGAWTALLGGPRGGFATGPVLTGDGRGHLVAFVVGADGALWTSSQLGASPATMRWRAWVSLGRPAGSTLVGLPAIGLGPDGRFHAFVRAAGGTLWEARQSRAGGGWSKWDRTPFASHVVGDPTAARDSSGALQVFAIATDGNIVVNRQARGGGRWTGWRSLGKPGGLEASFDARPAVVRDGAGLLEAYVVLDGSIFVATQTKAGRWTSWTQFGGRNAGAVAVVLRSDRRVQIFALTTSGVLLSTIREGKTWTTWMKLGHGLSTSIATSFGADGSVRVLSESNARALVVRSGDPQEFDGRSLGPLDADLAKAQAQAWTRIPSLPRPVNLGFARVGM